MNTIINTFDLTIKSKLISDSRQDGSKWVVTLSNGKISQEFEWQSGPGNRIISKKRFYGDIIHRSFSSVNKNDDIDKYRDVKYEELYGNPNLTVWQAEKIEDIWKQSLPKPPTLTGILESLSLDCQSFERSSGFSDWAKEFGYSDDSIKAKEIYYTVIENCQKMKSLLGNRYQEFLETEYE